MMSSKGVAVSPAALPGVSDPSTGSGLGRSVWVWVALSCVVLLGSWATRLWQDRRFSQEAGYIEDCPFPLKMISRSLGVWRMVDGGELALDNQTARITGCTEYIMRNYLDDSTGVMLRVLVLFGPAEPVIPHTPQVCFPATGYTEIEAVIDKAIPADDGKSYLFRTAIYGKPGGRFYMREEAYHSFRLDGTWSPNVGAGQKFPRKNPGVFKVQVQRIVAAGEHRGRDNPIEQFLAVLVPDIERRVAEKRPSSGLSKPPTPPDTKKSATNSTTSTTIRTVRPTGAFLIADGDADRDADRSTTLALTNRTDDPGRDAGQETNETNRQHKQQNRREVKHQHQVRQATHRVSPALLGHGRIQVVSTVGHARHSFESAGLGRGRGKTLLRDECKTSSTSNGRGCRGLPVFAEVGKPEGLVSLIIHPGHILGQIDSAGRPVETVPRVRSNPGTVQILGRSSQTSWPGGELG